MMEQVYAAGLRDLNKVLELDYHLEAIARLRYRVDGNHDPVYLELDNATLNGREIRAIFLRLGLNPWFIGAIPRNFGRNRKRSRLAFKRL
jgi:hypothetical protein